METILIADDNQQITSILADYAKNEGYDVKLAFDGKEAIDIFYAGGIDLILLDVMMPKYDGFAVCREIRKQSTIPIIMVTARGEDFERIMGLDIGADDYIVKPFSAPEVMARIRAILRRINSRSEHEQKPNILNIDNLVVDINSFHVSIEEKTVSLTKKELELLWTLVQSPGRVYSRNQLLDMIWGYDYYGDNRTVDSHIKRLRAKLEKYKHPNWEITTIWGVGYKFEVLDEDK